jgi:hypothetical protein
MRLSRRPTAHVAAVAARAAAADENSAVAAAVDATTIAARSASPENPGGSFSVSAGSQGAASSGLVMRD